MDDLYLFMTEGIIVGTGEDSLASLLMSSEEDAAMALDIMSTRKKYSFLPPKTAKMLEDCLLENQSRTDEMSRNKGFYMVEKEEEGYIVLMYNNPRKFVEILKKYVSEIEEETTYLQQLGKVHKEMLQTKFTEKVAPSFEFFSQLSSMEISEERIMRTDVILADGSKDPKKEDIQDVIRQALRMAKKYRDILIEKSGLGEEYGAAYSPTAIYKKLLDLSANLDDIKIRLKSMLLNSKGIKYLIVNERFIRNIDLKSINQNFRADIENALDNCQHKLDNLLAPPAGIRPDFNFSELEETLEIANFFYNSIVPRTSQTIFYASILNEAIPTILGEKESPRDFVPLEHMKKHNVPGYEFFHTAVEYLEEKIAGGTTNGKERF